MTNNLKLHQEVISDLLYKKDFPGLYQLFTTDSFSFTEFLIFYKRANNPRDKKAIPLFNQSEFWQSQLPHFYLDNLLASDLKISFYQAYFSKDSFCNHELNIHLLSLSAADFVRFFKLWKSFSHANFWDSLSRLSEGNSQIERLKKEFEIVIKEQQKLKVEEERDNQYLLQFNLGEILLTVTLLYYEFKQEGVNLNNKGYQTKIEVALVDEIDRILKLFKSRNKINSDCFKFPTNNFLQSEYKKYEAPHHVLGKKGKITPLPEEQKFISHLIRKSIDRVARKGCLELYLCGFADFETTILNPAPLITNKRFETFQFNNTKSQPEEMFLSEFKMDSLGKITKSSRTKITNERRVLEFYGVPIEIPFNGKAVAIDKILKLLKHFSVFKGPVERTIFPDGNAIIMNQGDETFANFFGANESITVFEFDPLIKKISNYFKWSEEDTILTFDFICTDLINGEFSYSWVGSPFLRINSQIIWLGSFLKDRRWDNILINKLKNDKPFVKLINTLSRNFEIKIEESFLKGGLKAKSGIPFKSSDGQTGEIDVLAYKEGCLFIVEAKSGSRSDDFSHAVLAEVVRLEGCAAEQLKKITSYIQEDWEKIKGELQIEDPISIDKVEFVPLIITDYFEGDLLLYKSSFRKISLLELDIILSNKKRELLEMYEVLQRMRNSNNPHFNPIKQEGRNWDLWNGNKEFRVQQLINCIEQNLIWQDLEQTWKFKEMKFYIG
jgi:hypothetical protein